MEKIKIDHLMASNKGLSLLLVFACFCLSALANKPEKIFFHSFDNTRIAFTDEGKGEVVLLIHGFIVNGSSWSKTVLKKKLLEQGYRVIAPDLRGNGSSDKPQNKEAYQNNAEVQDLLALADHLDLKQYMAIGYSRGSIVLAKLLTKEKRITKAVFGGMGLDFTNPNWERRVAFADAFSGRTPANDLTKGAISYAKSVGADLMVLGFLQDYQPVTSINELHNIRIKTVVICGDKDKDNGSPSALQKELPNSQLVFVRGNHNDVYKQEDFAAAVLDFLFN